MRVTIPHPDRPAEPSEIERFMKLIEDCKVPGGWNMTRLEKHLESRDSVWQAIERLNHVMDDIYPPIVQEPVYATEEVRVAS